MKVKELIKKLQDFEPELEVMVFDEDWFEHTEIYDINATLEDYETDGKKIIEIRK